MNENNIIPAGAIHYFGDPSTDVRQPVNERFENPKTVQKVINEDRLNDQMRHKLEAEFGKIDLNKDEFVDAEELKSYFRNQKGITDQEQVDLLVEQIIYQCDQDGDGRLTLKEYTHKYVETRERLMQRKDEVMRLILDHYRQFLDVEQKLEEAKYTEQLNSYGIRNDTKLKVHVVDAVNLAEDRRWQVLIYQDKSMSDSNWREGSGPIWNEAFLFDIKNPYNPVQIILRDESEVEVINQSLDLNQNNYRDYRIQGQDIWCYAQYNERNEPVEEGPKLRLRIHYSYSDVQKFTTMLVDWTDQIRQDREELLNIQNYLENLCEPFDFLIPVLGQQAAVLGEQDRQDLQEQVQGDNEHAVKERELEQRVDAYADEMAHRAGYREVPWLGIAYIVLIIQMFLSFLSQFHRPDFVTITACALGFYFLEFAQTTRRHQFRKLVALIFLSAAYDVAWIFLNRDAEDDSDGGVERPIKNFARTISYISLIWRVIVAIVFWKCSLEFVQIVKGKNVDGKANSLEERVNQIFLEFDFPEQEAGIAY